MVFGSCFGESVVSLTTLPLIVLFLDSVLW